MKKMKKYFYIMLTIIIVGSTTACNDWLDLRPESEIILDDFWQTQADVESVLAACYRGLTEEDAIYRMIVWGELRSDNMIQGSGFHHSRFDMQRILDGDLTANNTFSSWVSFYTVINFCNNLLHFAPEVVNRDRNFSEADLQRLRAEVLTIRSLAYFYLVRAFRDVPLILEPSIDDRQNFNLPKSTENVVLDQIIRDLLEARQYARVDFGRRDHNKGRITRGAVNALLTDVFLWAGRYQEAVHAANQVINDPQYQLVDQSLKLAQVFFLGNSTESIFELQFNENVQINSAVSNLFGHAGRVMGELAFPGPLAVDFTKEQVGAFSPFFFALSPTVRESEFDIRAKDFIRQFSGMFFIFKYTGLRTENELGQSIYRPRNTTSNWIVYRLSDVILMKAEALVQLAKTVDGAASTALLQEAVDMVNITYLRSNSVLDGAQALNLADYPTINDVDLLVLRERQRELMFEGKRWFDLVRWSRREGSTGTLNTFLMRANPGSTGNIGAPVLDAMYMPISRRELEANPNLIQNPFYEEFGGPSRR